MNANNFEILSRENIDLYEYYVKFYSLHYSCFLLFMPQNNYEANININVNYLNIYIKRIYDKIAAS